MNKLEQKKMLSVFIVVFISFYKSTKYLIFTGNRAERTPWCCKFVSFKILTEITASYNYYHSYVQCFSYDLHDMYTLLKLYQLLIRKKIDLLLHFILNVLIIRWIVEFQLIYTIILLCCFWLTWTIFSIFPWDLFPFLFILA